MDNLIVYETDDAAPTSNFRKLRHLVPADDIADDIADGFSNTEVDEFMRAADLIEAREAND